MNDKAAFSPTPATKIPPNLNTVWIYFSQKGQLQPEAKRFYEHYKLNHWKTKRGLPVQNWMNAANKWIWDNRNV